MGRRCERNPHPTDRQLSLIMPGGLGDIVEVLQYGADGAGAGRGVGVGAADFVGASDELPIKSRHK